VVLRDSSSDVDGAGRVQHGITWMEEDRRWMEEAKDTARAKTWERIWILDDCAAKLAGPVIVMNRYTTSVYLAMSFWRVPHASEEPETVTAGGLGAREQEKT